ncbi:hypothetical protein [Novispirillum itersonii]|uniref:hypothetical protein n=1 Tax=Novispirillum itersonii TaxID=189 RepID=UPI00038009FB|nr:hypothetical protein [Novispirillum itersonii]
MSEEQIRQLIREAVQPKATAPAPSQTGTNTGTIIVGLTSAALLAIIALVGIVAVVR